MASSDPSRVRRDAYWAFPLPFCVATIQFRLEQARETYTPGLYSLLFCCTRPPPVRRGSTQQAYTLYYYNYVFLSLSSRSLLSLVLGFDGKPHKLCLLLFFFLPSQVYSHMRFGPCRRHGRILRGGCGGRHDGNPILPSSSQV